MAEEEPPPPPTETPVKLGRAPASFRGSFARTNRDRQDNDKPRFRAGGGRLFVGNLESEKISKEDFKGIFEAYGEVVEISIHRSYGFVQFAKEADMVEAMKNENGREIGSRRIDIQRAKQSEKGRNNDSRFTGKRGRDNRDRDRSPPTRRRIQGNGRHFGPKPVLPPKNGAVMKIILLGEMQRNFAQRVADSIGENFVPVELEMLDGRTLSQALRDAEANRSRYVCIVGRENITKGTTTIKLLHLKEDRRCPTYDLRTDDLVDLVISEERKLGFEVGPKSISYGATSNPMAAQQNLVNLNPLQATSGLLPPPPGTLLQMQQQLSALSQQISSLTQPPPTQPAYQQPQSNAIEMQGKIMQELSRLQQQAAKIQQIKAQPPQMQHHQQTHGYNPNLQPYSGPPSVNNSSHQSSASGATASPAQIANLSKLLSSIQKIKGSSGNNQ